MQERREQIGNHSIQPIKRRRSLLQQKVPIADVQTGAYERNPSADGVTRRTTRTTLPQTKPYADRDEEDEQEGAYAPPRLPTSVKRYQQPHRAMTMMPTQVTEDLPASGLTLNRFLLWCGLIFFSAVILALMIVWWVFPALNRWNDDRAYGFPRITKAIANVGHGDKNHPYSQFIAINNNGVIDVIEITEGSMEQKSPHVFVITSLTGSDAQYVPVSSLSFEDENGDGKPDMEVVVNNVLYIWYNDGTTFKPKL